MGMTTNEAIEILRKNRPTSDPRPCGVELCDAVDMAISALRQQEHFRDLTKKVEPLTLDELRQIDGEPIYIVDGDVAWWDIVSFSVQDWLYLAREEELRYSRYGEWLAYRQKPEEGTV